MLSVHEPEQFCLHTLPKAVTMTISEDLHHFLSRAIILGHLNSNHLRLISTDEESRNILLMSISSK